METNKLIQQLKGGMIVSCQAEGDDPFNVDPEYMALFARDAEVPDHNNLPIYHVHGIIPEHGDIADKVVFS